MVIRRLTVLFMCCLFSGFASSVDAGPGRLRLDVFLSDLSTLGSHFEQQLFDEYGELMETSQGEVAISRPGKFRWEYQQPYRQLIVTNGTMLWVYDVDLEQVSVNPFADSGAGSPAALLVRDIDIDQHYSVAETADDQGLTWVSLTPLDASSQYSAIDIGLDEGGLRGIKLRDNLNQLTVIYFDNVQRNSDLGDDIFDFQPPAGVDVMNGAGS
jgi:outer membrane lipoprotein carrier protein